MRMPVGVVLTLFTLVAGVASLFLWHFGVPTRDREFGALVHDGSVGTHVSVEVGRLLTLVDSGPAWFPASLFIPIGSCALVCGFVLVLHSMGWRFRQADSPFEGFVRSLSIFAGFGALAGLSLGAVGVAVRPESRGLVLTSEGSALAQFSDLGLLNQSSLLFLVSSTAVWVFCSFPATFVISSLGFRVGKNYLTR